MGRCYRYLRQSYQRTSMDKWLQCFYIMKIHSLVTTIRLGENLGVFTIGHFNFHSIATPEYDLMTNCSRRMVRLKCMRNDSSIGILQFQTLSNGKKGYASQNHFKIKKVCFSIIRNSSLLRRCLNIFFPVVVWCITVTIRDSRGHFIMIVTTYTCCPKEMEV